MPTKAISEDPEKAPQPAAKAKPTKPKAPKKKQTLNQKRAKHIRYAKEVRLQMVSDALLAKLTYREIASICKVSISTIHSDVKQLEAELRQTALATIEQAKGEALTQLERLFAKAWMRVEAGEQGAIGEALKVRQEINKVRGIYAPSVMEITGNQGKPLFPTGAIVAALRAAEANEGTNAA